jgi:hypothetical protein
MLCESHEPLPESTVQAKTDEVNIVNNVTRFVPDRTSVVHFETTFTAGTCLPRLQLN